MNNKYQIIRRLNVTVERIYQSYLSNQLSYISNNNRLASYIPPNRLPINHLLSSHINGHHEQPNS